MSFLTNMFGNTKVTPATVASTSTVAAPSPLTPLNFNGGGLSANFNGNGYDVTANGARTGVVGDLGNTFGALGDQYGALANTVAPGYNDLLKARLTDLNNQATSAIGDLKQNLRSRRILGSSFGEDTINRLNTGINQQRDAVIADNFLQSLQAKKELIGQQYQAYAQKFQTGLDELNLEASTASGLLSNASGILQQNQQLLERANEFNASALNSTNQFNAGATNKANEFNANMSNNQAEGFGSFLGKVALAPVTGGGSVIGNFLGGKK